MLTSSYTSKISPESNNKLQSGSKKDQIFTLTGVRVSKRSTTHLLSIYYITNKFNTTVLYKGKPMKQFSVLVCIACITLFWACEVDSPTGNSNDTDSAVLDSSDSSDSADSVDSSDSDTGSVGVVPTEEELFGIWSNADMYISLDNLTYICPVGGGVLEYMLELDGDLMTLSHLDTLEYRVSLHTDTLKLRGTDGEVLSFTSGYYVAPDTTSFTPSSLDNALSWEVSEMNDLGTTEINGDLSGLEIPFSIEPPYEFHTMIAWGEITLSTPVSEFDSLSLKYRSAGAVSLTLFDDDQRLTAIDSLSPTGDEAITKTLSLSDFESAGGEPTGELDIIHFGVDISYTDVTADFQLYELHFHN